MKAARRIEDLAKVVILGLLLATFVFAPFGVVAVNADGGSNGQPLDPPTDSTLDGAGVGELPPDGDASLVSLSADLTLLRFSAW